MGILKEIGKTFKNIFIDEDIPTDKEEILPDELKNSLAEIESEANQYFTQNKKVKYAEPEYKTQNIVNKKEIVQKVEIENIQHTTGKKNKEKEESERQI